MRSQKLSIPWVNSLSFKECLNHKNACKSKQSKTCMALFELLMLARKFWNWLIMMTWQWWFLTQGLKIYIRTSKRILDECTEMLKYTNFYQIFWSFRVNQNGNFLDWLRLGQRVIKFLDCGKCQASHNGCPEKAGGEWDVTPSHLFNLSHDIILISS